MNGRADSCPLENPRHRVLAFLSYAQLLCTTILLLHSAVCGLLCNGLGHSHHPNASFYRPKWRYEGHGAVDRGASGWVAAWNLAPRPAFKDLHAVPVLAKPLLHGPLLCLGELDAAVDGWRLSL